MLVADRYDEYTDVNTYGRSRFDRYSRYEGMSYDDRYEAERRGTSDAERERLMASLERTGSRSRVVARCEESRYGFRASSYEEADNNYDRMLDRRSERTERKEKKIFNKKKTPLVVAYIVFALVAVLAVTFSLAGMNKTEEPVEMSATVTSVEASAEEAAVAENVAEAEESAAPQVGGEGYVLLKSGEIVAVEVPEITEVTEEKEKGFDKFCSWLNKIFGGKE